MTQNIINKNWLKSKQIKRKEIKTKTVTKTGINYGIYHNHIITNCLQSVPVKNFLKFGQLLAKI